jgi:hypothetical protein
MAASNTLPYFDGDLSIAARLTAGTTREVIWFGTDSLMAKDGNRPMQEVLEFWRFPNVIGFCNFTSVFGNSAISEAYSTAATLDPGGTSTVSGAKANYAPLSQFVEHVFDGSTVGADTFTFSNRLWTASFGSQRDVWSASPIGSAQPDWLARKLTDGRTITCTAYHLQHPNGAGGGIYVQTRISSAQLQASSTRGLNGTLGVVTQSVPFTLADLTGIGLGAVNASGVVFEGRILAGTVTVSGKSAITCGVDLDTGETTGAKLIMGGYPGYTHLDYADTNKYSAASWSFLSAAGVTIAFIQLTINGAGIDDATLLSGTQTLINTIRGAAPNCAIVLCASWQNTIASYQQNRADVYRTLARSNAGCLFLNFDRATPYPLITGRKISLSWSSANATALAYQAGDIVVDGANGTFVNVTGTYTTTAPHSDATNWKQVTGIADGPATLYASDRANYLLEDDVHQTHAGRKLTAAIQWGLIESAAAAAGKGVLTGFGY